MIYCSCDLGSLLKNKHKFENKETRRLDQKVMG